MKILIRLLFVVIAPATLHATPIGTAVTNCAVGSFCNVPMKNLTGAIIDSAGGGHILSYSSKMAWDNVNKKIYFVGSGHLECTKFITYTDATDTWTSVVPPWSPCPNPGDFFYHGYQHSTFDSVAQKYYVRRYGGGFADVYDVARDICNK